MAGQLQEREAEIFAVKEETSEAEIVAARRSLTIKKNSHTRMSGGGREL